MDVEMVTAFSSKLKHDLYQNEKKRLQLIQPPLSDQQIKLQLENLTKNKGYFKQVAGNVCDFVQVEIS